MSSLSLVYDSNIFVGFSYTTFTICSKPMATDVNSNYALYPLQERSHEKLKENSLFL